MKFTVLIPTFDNGPVIRFAIESVLAQAADMELFVVADGAPPETLSLLDAYGTRDPRLRVFKFGKGERHGEAWRHEALRHADSDAVCYLSDDDVWFTDHLATLGALLAEHDFGHTRQVNVMPDFTINAYARDLGDPAMRRRYLSEKCNFFGLSVAGHRLDAYRRLNEGWAPAPPDIGTDYHMWRKWVRAEGMRLVSSASITALHMPRIYRRGQSAAACANETGFWAALFSRPGMIEALRRRIPPDEAFICLHDIVADA